MSTTAEVTPCILVGKGSRQQDLGSSIVELEVQEDHELAGVFRIKVAVGREDAGRWRFLDEDFAQPWAQLQIKLNVSGDEQDLMTGYVTNVRVHLDTDESRSYV